MGLVFGVCDSVVAVQGLSLVCESDVCARAETVGNRNSSSDRTQHASLIRDLQSINMLPAGFLRRSALLIQASPSWPAVNILPLLVGAVQMIPCEGGIGVPVACL